MRHATPELGEIAATVGAIAIKIALAVESCRVRNQSSPGELQESNDRGHQCDALGDRASFEQASDL